MQRYALVTGLSNEEPAIIELLHEGPQRPLGVGLNLPKHGRNYPYKAIKFVPGLWPSTGRPCQGAAYGWR
jgi:hypothetical protein